MSESARVRVVVPPMTPSAQVDLVRIAPTADRLAFVELRGTEAFLCAAAIGADEPRDRVALGPFRVLDVIWSPDGRHLAYTLRHGDPLDRRRFVGWCAADGEGPAEQGRVEGATLAWLPGGLVVADPSAGELLAVGLDGEVRRLCAYQDDGGIESPPSLAVTPEGGCLAFTTRLVDQDVSGVWTLDLTRSLSRSPAPAPSLLTQVPGADAEIRVFWPPMGLTLGMLITHPSLARSAIIVVPALAGDGEVLHRSPLLDRAVRPAWAADASRLYFVRAAEEDVYELVALDPSTRSLTAVPAEVSGLVAGRAEPRVLGTGDLVLDGGDHAYLLTFSTPV